MKYGTAPARREKLISLIVEQGYCSTGELVAALGVSDMTVRRDVQRLAEEGLVRVVHGGVSVLSPDALEGSGDYQQRSTRMSSMKLEIGRRAAQMIQPNETIALDVGTTVLEVARAIPLGSQITVVSNSAPVLNELMSVPDIALVGLGGTLHRDTLSYTGTSTLDAIASLQVSTLFLAASSISERGVFCGNDFDAVVKRALISISSKIVLVCDSTKFSANAMVRVCGLNAIDTIVVDKEISPENMALVKRANIDLLLV